MEESGDGGLREALEALVAQQRAKAAGPRLVPVTVLERLLGRATGSAEGGCGS